MIVVLPSAAKARHTVVIVRTTWVAIVTAALLPHIATGSGGIMDDERLLVGLSRHPDIHAGVWHRGQRKRVTFETSCYYTHEPELKYGCQPAMKNTDDWAQDPQRREEKMVLMDLFRVTTGRDWRVKDNWEDLGDPCWDYWYGITCDEHGYVIAIELSDNHLVGWLPTNLGQLTSLLKLDISSTKPSYHAHTNIYANDISGPLPSLAAALRLEEIEISGNRINALPPDLWENGISLRVLSASHNLLTALPNALRRFTSLHTLELTNNNIRSTFPEDFGYLTNARFVSLQYNQIQGAIPSNIVDMNRIRILDISHNVAISGELPLEIITLWPEVDYVAVLNTSIGGYVASLCLDVPFCWRFMYDTHGDMTWASAADVPDIVEQTLALAQGGR